MDVRTGQPARRKPRPHAGVCAVAAAAAVLALASAARAADTPQVLLQNKRCLDCHSQQKIVNLPPQERRTMLDAPPGVELSEQRFRSGLYVSQTHLAGSVHANVACVSCHADAEQLPHAPTLARASCGDCHDDAAAAYRRGVHAAVAAERPSAEVPNCASCHGGHDMLPKSDPKSRTYPLNVVRMCADCHEQHQDPANNGRDSGQFTHQYLESVHGRMVQKQGLIVAATCVDCHGPHEVQPSTQPTSPVHRDNVPQTCGTCHVGVANTFATSIHGRQLAAGNPGAPGPVCTDCHTAHSITRATTPGFRLDIVNECGDCHDKPLSEGGLSLYQTYRHSYHGQVTALGSMRGARCSDCHGAHNVLAKDDPGSPMHGDARREMCASCHAGATDSFAKFQPHADHTDGERFPLLHGVWWYFIIVISATFTFFGLHTLAWFARGLIHRFKHGAPKHDHAGPAIRRFNAVERINHAVIIVSFFGLTLTGMPLLFSDQKWAAVLATMFGGIHAAGVFHRLFAIMLVGNFAVHFFNVFRKCRKHGVKKVIFGPSTMLPRWRDVKDLFAMVRWFFRGGKTPTFDRWTYWEKFDYWAEIFGTSVIGFTGLMLWFPGLFSLVMPGWMFNIASLIHGYEALLAVGFIFTIHFFNANLRPDKFPVDTVMFTGHMPLEEYQHERGDEYKRMLESGELETMKVTPAPAWKRRFAIGMGMLAMLIGITMVALIVLAGFGVL